MAKDKSYTKKQLNKKRRQSTLQAKQNRKKQEWLQKQLADTRIDNLLEGTRNGS